MPKAVKYGLFLGILGLIVGLLLAFVNSITAPIIEAQGLAKVEETLNLVNDSYTWSKSDVSDNNVDGCYIGKDTNGNIQMYAYQTTTTGYKSGEIVIMTFIQNDEIIKVVLISMTDQTKGIGTQIENETYLTHFEGSAVTKYYNTSANDYTSSNVDVISGATYSSRAVISGIILACNEYMNRVR